MKELLFIMVAILIPPTLTYLGFVGGASQEAQGGWTQDRQVEKRATPAAETPRAEEARPRWYERS